jgi:hypothetical protein
MWLQVEKNNGKNETVRDGKIRTTKKIKKKKKKKGPYRNVTNNMVGGGWVFLRNARKARYKQY